MTLNEYQAETDKTRQFSPKMFMFDKDAQLIPVHFAYTALGLGESGECQNTIKKILRDNHGEVTPAIRESIKKELGDQLWYIAQMARDFNLTLDEVAQSNVDKLKSRKERGTIHGSGDNR